MATSKRTKQLNILVIILGVLHFLAAAGALLYFVPYAFITAEVGSKIVLSLTLVLSLILGAISLIVDVAHRGGLHRSMLWSAIIGVMYCLPTISTFIWIMAIASIVDELIICPLKEKAKIALTANREMDKRGV